MTPTTRRRASVLAVLLLLLAGLAVAVWQWRAHRQLAKVKQLQQELVSAQNLAPEQRREKFEQLRRATAQLSSGQRRDLAQEWQKRREGELKRYAAMSRAEQVHFLDQQIDRMEQMWRQMQANGGPRGPGGPGGPGAGGRPGGPGGQPARTPEQREQRRKERLDQTTPEFRALRDQFARDMAARRSQRGLPGAGSGRGGPRG